MLIAQALRKLRHALGGGHLGKDCKEQPIRYLLWLNTLHSSWHDHYAAS